MNELLTTQSLEGTPLTISATSMPSLDGMGTGAIRSSVFEINNSSSNVNFIAHVWACCSDLLLAEEAYGPKGRQGKGSEDPLLIKLSSSAGILHLQCNRRYSSLNSTRLEDLSKSAFFVATSLRNITSLRSHTTFQREMRFNYSKQHMNPRFRYSSKAQQAVERLGSLSTCPTG